MFDDLRDGPVPCIGARVFSFSATVPKKVYGLKCEGCNCLDLVTIGHSILVH
jgi:hypothetical protein